MSKQDKVESPIPDENMTSDSESDSECSDSPEDTSDTDECSDSSEDTSDTEADGTVVGDTDAPIRFIFGEEAQARSLDGVAYGIDKKGHYFVICKDGDTVGGLLVHALIERNVEEGILLPISKPGANTTADTVDEK